jgi:hypothetical protein
MKKLFLFFLLLLSPVVYAQDLTTTDKPVEIKDFEGLRAEFKQYSQDPETKIVKFEMTLNSKINSDRVRIEWTAVGISEFVDEREARRDLKIEAGKSYVIPVSVRILGDGIHEVFGKAESVQVDSSFLVTVRKNFASNASAEVLPITNEYSTAKTLSQIKNAVFIIIGVAAVIAAVFFIFKRFVLFSKAEPTVEYPEDNPDPVPVGSK